MSKNVLVADDSQTIQKVVSLTLASEDFEITSLDDPAKLLAAVSSTDYDLILLDFEFSDTQTGYELAKELRSKTKSPILIMFGAFDSVESDKLDEAKVNDHITKPFDGGVFVKKCKALVEGKIFGEEVKLTPLDEVVAKFDDINVDNKEHEIKQSEDKLTKDSGERPLSNNLDEVNDFDVEDWVVESQNVQEDEPATQEEEKSPSDRPTSMKGFLSEWGLEVPSIIGSDNHGSEKNIYVPPVIEKKETPAPGRKIELEQEYGQKFPVENDLEYPDLSSHFSDLNPSVTLESEDGLGGESDEEEDDGKKSSDLNNIKLSSKLISMSELEANEAEINEDVKEDPKGIDKGDRTVILENIIKQEKSEEDLWAVDVDDTESPVNESISKDGPSLQLDSSVPAGQGNGQIDLESLQEKLQPMIEDAVKKYLQEAAEKVAWEVLPDLAENLVKQELEKISKQTLDS